MLEPAGLLDGGHFELVEGELIDKRGKTRPHVRTTQKAARVLRELFAAGCVETEAPIDIAVEANQMNEPEPDIVVLCPGAEDLDRNPGPAEVLLVVEVSSDATLRHDLTTKARLYAWAHRAGIRRS